MNEAISQAPLSERDRRWRLLLGQSPDLAGGTSLALSSQDAAIDAALAALYDRNTGGDSSGKKSTGSLGASAPKVARWLGDIRTYFPSRIVQVMQNDAIERLGLRHLLLEPEMLDTIEPDVHMVATLASLSNVMSATAKNTARQVVNRVVEEVKKRLEDHLRQSVRGALRRSLRTNRPRPGDINWNRTIAANLANYIPEKNTVIPEKLVGYGRASSGFERDIILVVDQSGSMASSVVYASIFSSVLASISALRTRFIAYDTAVVDLSEKLSDPVDLIFGTQLGGGTDTSRALAYCEPLVERPRETVMVLISDLYDSDRPQMVRRLAKFQQQGVQVITLLALSDDGKPSYDKEVGAQLAALGIPAFACTPDAFPDLIALAINKGDIAGWAASNEAAKE